MSGAQDLVAFQGEVQFAGYNDSNTQGARVVFWLPDPEQLNYFRGIVTKKGGKAGQRFMMVLVEIGDDEQPIDQAKAAGLEDAVKGGPLSQHAGRLCKDSDFQRWVAAEGGDKRTFGYAMGEDGARAFIIETCKVDSRKDLDHDRRAAQAYENFVRRPFVQWLGTA